MSNLLFKTEIEEYLFDENKKIEMKNSSIINMAWYRATKEIIDRCVSPKMHANAMSMLDKALREAMKAK